MPTPPWKTSSGSARSAGTPNVRKHTYYVTVQVSPPNGPASPKTSHSSSTASNRGRAAPSVGPSTIYSSTTATSPTVDTSGPAYGPRSIGPSSAHTYATAHSRRDNASFCNSAPKPPRECHYSGTTFRSTPRHWNPSQPFPPHCRMPTRNTQSTQPRPWTSPRRIHRTGQRQISSAWIVIL